MAVPDEAFRESHHVQGLQRAGMNPDRARLQRRPVALVEDAGADPAGEQFRGEHQPGRSGPDDKHLAVHAG
jgi:hypothetical protein